MLIYILIGFLLIWILGYFSANLFTSNFTQKSGLGFLLGFPIFTLAIHLWIKLGNNINPGIGWVVLISLVILFLVLNLILIKDLNIPKLIVSKDKLVLVGISFLILIVMSSVLRNLNYPISDWDAITVFDNRARIVLAEGNYKSLSNMTQPMYTSLANWWLYSIGLPTPMIFYSFIYSSFILTSWGILKSKYSDKITALLTLTLALSPGLFKYSTIAYLNMPYTIYFTLAVAYLAAWTRNKDSKLLILSLLLTGFSVWTRSTEPFWLIIPAIIIWTKLTNRYFKILMIIISIIVGLVAINKYHFDFIVSLKALNFIKWAVVEYYIGYFVIALLLFIEDWKNNRQLTIFSTTVIGCFLILWFGTNVLLKQDPGWVQMPDTIRRIGMLFPPLIIFWFSETVTVPKLSK